MSLENKLRRIVRDLLPNIRYHWGENKNMHDRKPFVIWGVGVYTTGLLVL